MKTYPRSNRIGEHIHRVLADVLKREIHDPRLSSVSITQVQMSPDLKNAHVFFAISGQKINPAMAMAGFSAGMGFIKRTMAKELGLRYMPDLRFSYDTILDKVQRIDSLLREEGEAMSSISEE